MIKITVKKLVEAAESQALARYFSLEKPISIAWKNRKQVSACNEELKLYHERRIALCDKYGKRNEQTNTYEFDLEPVVSESATSESATPASTTPDPVTLKSIIQSGPQKKAFDLAMQELWEQTISLPGEPISVAVLTGNLSEVDGERLEPFLTD